MPEPRPRRTSPADFDFEGTGDDARAWLDSAYGTSVGLRGDRATVSHRRQDRSGVSFDHLKIDAPVAFDAAAMPVLVVVDVLHGEIEYTRDRVTDRGRGGDTIIASGWNMPFTGVGNGYEVRNTGISAEVLDAAIREVDPDASRDDLSFASFVPRSPEAAARWRATVGEMTVTFPHETGGLAHTEASRLLGHTLLHTFTNNVVDGRAARALERDQRDATPSTVRRAQQVIEERSHEDLSLADLAAACHVSPRALQYAFRHHLGCTPAAYLKQVRLDLVHQALRDVTTQSVSDVASRYGFFNPGRFAADYRQVFGENPGQTRARSTS